LQIQDVGTLRCKGAWASVIALSVASICCRIGSGALPPAPTPDYRSKFFAIQRVDSTNSVAWWLPG
jgi:hypothetical protein